MKNIGKIVKYTTMIGAGFVVDAVLMPFATYTRNPIKKVAMTIGAFAISSMVGNYVGEYAEVKANKIVDAVKRGTLEVL